MPTPRNRKTKLIGRRSWQELRELWPNYIATRAQAGIAPSVALHELPEVEGILRSLGETETRHVDEEVAGLRNGLFYESVYSLHKAAHVLSAASIHINEGMCSWSLSSAYHSALWAAKASLGFLGIQTVDCSYGQYLVDVWSYPRKKKKGSQIGDSIVFSRLRSLKHKHVWQYFLRAISQTDDKDDFGVDEWIVQMLQSDANEFTSQRNRLHYRVDGWPHNDLHSLGTVLSFRHRSSTYDSGHEAFTVELAVRLTRLAYKILVSIAENSSTIKKEITLLDSWSTHQHGHLYNAEDVQE